MSAIESFSTLAQKCISTCFIPPLVKVVLDGATEGKNEEEITELFMKTLAISQTDLKIPLFTEATSSKKSKASSSKATKSKPRMLKYDEFINMWEDGYYCAYMGTKLKHKDLICAADCTEEDFKACDENRLKLRCHTCASKASVGKFEKLFNEKRNGGLNPTLSGSNIPDLSAPAEAVKKHIAGDNEMVMSPVLAPKKPKPTKALKGTKKNYTGLRTFKTHDYEDFPTSEESGVHWLLRRGSDKKCIIVGALDCYRPADDDNKVTLDYKKHLRKLTDDEDKLRQTGFAKVLDYTPDPDIVEPEEEGEDVVITDDEEDVVVDTESPEDSPKVTPKAPSAKKASPTSTSDLDDDELDLVEDDE